MSDELVVLLDHDGNRVGSAAKSSVHHRDTPLHLAFSCYLFDDSGRVLLTRRALGKKTWPGVWTNSFCGHPAPGEAMVDAVHRRARQELGAAVRDVVCVLPDFRYRAEAADGTVENEVCPVFCALVDGPVAPSPDEVMDLVWAQWAEVRTAAALGWAISPWAQSQVPLLEAAGLPEWSRASV
ncbi:isopentenyl-diphosphate Delta-isomerase [Mycolicibacterium parafortuitum]|uniref:Isopentenyl-diphosphate Delta-isomerase n=1 Tax=Mycolicibacterium parafortuitum TaxID=39692 RepID=A0A375YRS0_MYCPF|nr:isopentenyl-diphosphate Delta-isomerase [Mycolicibacterium parafortuitum]ORB27519.1 isopentenyl-diphosphate delta-isomerase [Mycolicibacterium parafortuitum]SRX83848.1 Isopentenyl-diphosphate Delta-isomerase [Isoptericola variabilis 225] [Mycolicibacterium parafortuitum]